jgi:glycosyltransferase involved in cell wall biosynthesis
MVALEAMAAGKPVVAYNSGALSEIIVDGLTGFVVPRGNIDALAFAVKYLLENEEVAIKMGIEGRKRVEKLFNLNRMVEEYAYELRRNIED